VTLTVASSPGSTSASAFWPLTLKLCSREPVFFSSTLTVEPALPVIVFGWKASSTIATLTSDEPPDEEEAVVFVDALAPP
jgi:hypothetical protein